MRIGGIVDISTKDIPNRSSMVIFTVGCNFRCSFCHNKHLLLKDAGKERNIGEIMRDIKSNLLISSVSITGGEPTLQEELIDLCKKIKEGGKFVSVDSNGSHPERVKKLLPHVDRIALDLKASPLNAEKYKRVVGVGVDPNKIIHTVELALESQVELEIRTTYVKPLITPKDIHGILEFLSKKNFHGTYVLQQYQFSEGVGNNWEDTFERPTHGELLDVLRPYKDEALPFRMYLRDEVVGYQPIDDLYDVKIEEIT